MVKKTIAKFYRFHKGDVVYFLENDAKYIIDKLGNQERTYTIVSEESFDVLENVSDSQLVSAR